MDEDTLAFLAELEREAAAGPTASPVPPGERECPICKQKMVPDLDYGVSIDVCAEHGIWLDRHELPAIMAFVRSGERLVRKHAILKAKSEGRWSGAALGIWSLLFKD